MSAAVFLVNPKTPFNVGTSIRACSIFGAHRCYWSGERMWLKIGERLPREERMKDYTGVHFGRNDYGLEMLIAGGYAPVAIEITVRSSPLSTFVHPDKAVYIFGPEDGSIPKDIKAICYHFVRIPTLTRTPLNLAQSVNIVLYDRFIKSGLGEWAAQ